MRVTLIGPVYPYRGGISHYTGMLAGALSAAGHQVQVISFKRQYPAWLYPGKTDRDPSQQPLQIAAEYLLDPLYPWTWSHAAARIRAFAPDLVVIQWWTTFWAPAFAVLSRLVRRGGRRVVYMIHNVLPHERRWVDLPLARLALAGGTAYVVQTQLEQERLLELLPDAQTSTCPLPAYHQLVRTKLTQSEARQAWLTLRAVHPPFFGFVRPYKGVHILFDALSILKNQGLYPFLVVAGEFWQDRRSYEEQIERLGIAPQIHIEDRYIPDEEISAWFSAADCFVAPYIDGTQSAAATIALASGLPLIASQVVAAGIAGEHRAAIAAVAPGGDASALAGAIARTMSAPPGPPRVMAAGEDWQRLVDTLVQIIQPAETA